MNNRKNNICPKCGAELQENASFCLHCMTPLEPKQNIEKPKKPLSSKRKTIYIIVSILVVIAIVSASTVAAVMVKKHSPICTFEQFQTAVPIVSEKMGINSLWDENSFLDIAYSESEKVMQYSTDIDLNGAYLSVFFYNEGEEIYGYICDVQTSDVDKGKELLKCIAQSACNYYYTDIDEVFENETLYPRRQLDSPFEEYFTNLLRRTDEYNQNIKDGENISTKYIPMTDDDKIITLYVTERSNEERTLYDLAVAVQKD